MTYGEIIAVVKYKAEHEKAQNEYNAKLAAFTAYFGGYYSRPRVRLPETLAKAFPDIFGRTHDGGIKAENWQESERALLQIAANFKRKGGGKK